MLLYLLCLGVPFIVGMGVQSWLKRTFASNSQKPVMSGRSGAEVARAILDRNGLSSVPVEFAQGGSLSDHYDPRTRSVNLSREVYEGRSVAATAVAAHEVGHAIQHAKSYVPMTIRSAVWPVAAFGSQSWFIILIGGVIFGGASQLAAGAGGLGALLIKLAVLLYAFVVAFQLVTLPVELNASRRAAVQLQEIGLVNQGEAAGVRSTLTAAAMTYVAAALASLAQLLYFVLSFLGDR